MKRRLLRRSAVDITVSRGISGWMRWNKTRLLAMLASSAFIFLIGFSLLGGLILFLFSKDLPSPDHLNDRDQALSTQIFDRNGKSLYDIYGDKNRVLVTLAEIPPELVNATLATEDAEFYQHGGFDILGIFRAALQIVFKGNVQGGSTITQQLVKNTLLTSERTMTRKLKELVLALQIERRFTKDEILQMYLNEAPYGGQAWGVEAASHSFFGKSVGELTPSEAVLLAGMPQSPSAYLADPVAAEARRQTVIRMMEEKGWYDSSNVHHKISKEEADQMREDVPEISTIRQGILAPHFVWYVRELLEKRYGKEMVEQGGLRVTTTLDLDWHNKMQEIVTDEVKKSAGLQVGNGALVAIDPASGEIISMVGSIDYFDEENDGNVNVSTRLRQPGSSIKPFTYVTAFKQGYTPATMLVDAPTSFPGGAGNPEYRPVNYDGKYRGPVQLRYALANSLNIPAVKLLKLVGVENMLRLAYDMGLSTLEPTEENKTRFGLSVTLGGGEVTLLDLTSGFGVFANAGKRQDPVAILKVEDRQGNVLDEHKKVDPRVVITPEEAYLISNILADDGARSLVFGPGSLLNIPNHQVAVKTGTTDDKRDNWTVGYTPKIVIGVWVGNNDNSPMHPNLASGLTGATPIWRRAMTTFLEGQEKSTFERPAGIISLEVDKLSGKLPGEHTEEKRSEIFIKGRVPVEVDDLHMEIEICEEDDKIANDDCKDDDKTDKKVFIVLKDVLPEWQESVDKWIEENKKDDDQWHPPDEESDYEKEDDDDDDHGSLLGEVFGNVFDPVVKIVTPESGDSLSAQFEIEALVLTPYTVLKTEFYLDDLLLATDTSIPYKVSVSVSKTESGPHRLRVRGYDSSGGLGEEEIEITL